LISRLARNLLSDSLADTLFTEVAHKMLTENLCAALRDWLARFPPKAMHMLLHAQQVGFLTEVQMTSAPSGTGFVATVAGCVDGRPAIESHGDGTRKRDAEQVAALRFVGAAIGMPSKAKSVDLPKQHMASVPPTNYKGALLELCQSRGWASPVFETRASGPPHAMIFGGSAQLIIGGQSYRGDAVGAANKKAAEAIAAQKLLAQLPSPAKVTQSPVRSYAIANPVGLLQEKAQQTKTLSQFTRSRFPRKIVHNSNAV
jgi:hypothetical protein